MNNQETITHEASMLSGKMVPCVCGGLTMLVNVVAHKDREGDTTHWTGTCSKCQSNHTIFND